MLLRVEVHPGLLLGGEFESTATLPLHLAAEEAWMSINPAPGDAAPLAVLSERERSRLGPRP